MESMDEKMQEKEDPPSGATHPDGAENMSNVDSQIEGKENIIKLEEVKATVSQSAPKPRKQSANNKAKKNAKLSSPDRSRSRSKSPRAKKGESKSPCKKTPEKKGSSTKQAQKRKAKDVQNKEKVNDTTGPVPKQPKGEAKSNDSDSKQVLVETDDVEQNDTKPKAKRKYVRKNKKTDSKSSPDDTQTSSQCPTDSTADKAMPVENGDLPETEVKALTEKSRKKPGPKKGSKRKPKVDSVSASAPEQSETVASNTIEQKDQSPNEGENEVDSDTVDYNVNTVVPPKIAEQQTNGKNVVKIDDIEITELSDLNSSRDESAEENDIENAEEKDVPMNSQDAPSTIEHPTFISLDECKESDDSFLCRYPNCKYRGKSRVLLRKHLSHHHIYLCAHCDFHCNVSNELETHMVANHPQRWGRKKCKKCQRYIKGSEFDSHEVSCDGTKVYPCEQCEKVFKYESKLRDHEHKFHASIKCEQCEFIAESKTILKKHVSSMHRTKKPNNAAAAAAATATIAKPDTISKPDTVSKPESILSESNNVIEQSESIPKSPVGAILLSPLDETPEKIVANTITMPAQSASETNDATVTSASDVTGDSTTEPLQETKEKDMETDNNVIPDMTSITVPFVEKENMQITADSSGQVTLSIPETAAIEPLISPDSTTPALFQSLFKDGPIICDVEGCGIELKSTRLLYSHKKNVHNIHPSQIMFACEHPDCNLKFKKKGQLKKHYVVHTGERKYICTYEGCGKAFRHNANLKIHNLLHTGEKPIKCKFCTFACRQKSSLIHHMKTKHKEIGWPIKKEDLPKMDDFLNEKEERMEEGEVNEKPNHEANEEESSQGPESSSTNIKAEESEDKVEDIKPNNTKPNDTTPDDTVPNDTTPNEIDLPSPPLVSPKILSTPTKAMVKAMTPGFLLAAGAAKPLSPAAAFAPATNTNADVYDFNDEDEPNDIPCNKTEPLLKATKKTPPKQKPTSTTGDDGSTPAKKKRGPKKKKEEGNTAGKPDSPKGKKTTPKKKKAAAVEPEQKVSEPLAPQPEPIAETVPVEPPMEPVDKPNNEVIEEAPKPEIEPEGDSLVEEHVSENPLPSISPSCESVQPMQPEEVHEPEPEQDQEPEHAAFDDNMGPPHAPAPVYEHHDSPMSSIGDEPTKPEHGAPQEVPQPRSPIVNHVGQPSNTAMPSVPLERREEAVHQSPFSEISPVSQVPSNETRAISSVTSMQSPLKEPMSMDQATPLDMHVNPLHRGDHSSFDDLPDALSPHKKINSSFELPHDIDPDEAAKILEESDEREKNMRKEKEQMRDFGPDGYSKYLPSPPRPNKDFPDNLHLPSTTDRGSVGEPSPYDFPSYRQHPSDFSHIQGMDTQNKDIVDAPVYPDTSQRRPSSSYVPDFLPSMVTTNAGPPSVSSSYSTHSNSITQNQNDLSTYGASSAAGLPPFPPSSSSVPSYLPPNSSSFPSTTPVTSTSYSNAHTERTPSAGQPRPDPYRPSDSNTATATTTSASYTSSYPSRDLFGHYFQDPSLPLPSVGAQQDPRSLSYPAQQSSLQALQRSSADFLQRASASALPGMNYPSVTESLARLSQTTSQQPWIGHEERSRPWAQASPILMPPEIDTAGSLNRNPFSASRPELGSLDTAAKRPESTFPGVPQTVPSATDRYDVASAYMGSGHFNPATTPSNYSKTLAASNPQKHLEDAYRHSAAAMNDYRTLPHAPPSMTDMYSRMGMNPALGLDKYYPYSRATEAMYRSQQLGSNPFMPQTSTSAQMPYGDRDYARNPYAQDSAYGKYLSGSNLTQPLPPALQGAGDYFQPRPGAPDPYMHDPYRRSVIHNMMTRYF